MARKYGDFTETRNSNPHTYSISNSKIPISSCSVLTPSDLSEPPDIRNWFSSYGYESFVLDTEDELKPFDSGNSEIEKLSFDSDEQKQLGAEIHDSSGGLSSKPFDLSEPPDITNWFSSYVYESPVLNTEDEFKCLASAKSEVEKASLDSEKQNHLGTKCGTKICDGENFGSKWKETNESAPLEDNIDGDFIQNLESNFRLPEGLLERNECKEDDSAKVNEAPTNGFISTKKDKYGKENHGENVIRIDLKLPLNETKVGGGRRPLHETTNLQYKVAMPESSGKWRCPQRSKPELGPPLKQLRLEKWVRRVK